MLALISRSWIDEKNVSHIKAALMKESVVGLTRSRIDEKNAANRS